MATSLTPTPLPILTEPREAKKIRARNFIPVERASGKPIIALDSLSQELDLCHAREEKRLPLPRDHCSPTWPKTPRHHPLKRAQTPRQPSPPAPKSARANTPRITTSLKVPSTYQTHSSSWESVYPLVRRIFHVFHSRSKSKDVRSSLSRSLGVAGSDARDAMSLIGVRLVMGVSWGDKAKV